VPDRVLDTAADRSRRDYAEMPRSFGEIHDSSRRRTGLYFHQAKRCDRASIRREIGYLGTITGEKHSLKLDGNVQEDPPWFGEAERYKTSAMFNESALHIEARSNSGSTLAMIYSLTPEGDLLEEVVLNGRGDGGPIVAKRVGSVSFFESNRQR
jgi:hypothetical protein